MPIELARRFVYVATRMQGSSEVTAATILVVDDHPAKRALTQAILGLTSCKLATVAQGGRIWVEDSSPVISCARFPHDA